MSTLTIFTAPATPRPPPRTVPRRRPIPAVLGADLEVPGQGRHAGRLRQPRLRRQRPLSRAGQGRRRRRAARPTPACTAAPGTPRSSPPPATSRPAHTVRAFVGARRRRRRDLHPQHHRRAQPAGPLPARRHHRGRLRDRAPRLAAALARSAVRLAPPHFPGEAVARGRRGAAPRPDGPELLVVTGASNVTGELWPVADLAAVAHRHGARIAAGRRPARPAPAGRHRPRSTSTTSPSPGTSCTPRSAPACWSAGPDWLARRRAVPHGRRRRARGRDADDGT